MAIILRFSDILPEYGDNHRDEDLLERGYYEHNRIRNCWTNMNFFVCINSFFRIFFFDRGIVFLAKYGSIMTNFLSIFMIVTMIHAIFILFIGKSSFVTILTIIISLLTIVVAQFADMLVEKYYLKTQEHIQEVGTDISRLDEKMDKMDKKFDEILRLLSPKDEVVKQGWVKRE